MSDIVERLLIQKEIGLLDLPDSFRVVSYGDAADEIERLQAQNAKLREALEPFAAVAEYDIGDDEVDADYYRQPTSLRWAKAPAKVGDYRAARAALEGK